MDPGVCNSFQGPQIVFVQSSHTFQAREGGNVVSIPSSHRLRC